MKWIVWLMLILMPLPVCAMDYDTNDTVHFLVGDISHDYTNFTWNWSGFSDYVITNMTWNTVVTNVMLRLAVKKTGAVALDITNGTVTGGTSFWALIVRTNFPPDAPYYAEFIGYDGASYTTMPARSIAKGTITINHSLFQNTEASAWTNPLAGSIIGPPVHTLTAASNWPFLTIAVYDTNNNDIVDNSERLGDELPAFYLGTNSAVYLDAITNIPAGAAITITTNGRIRTVAHTDTSSQADIDNSAGNVLQDLAVDTQGHVTNAGSVDLDGRYYTETETDTSLLGYLKIDGTRAMTGNLPMGGHSATNLSNIVFSSAGGQIKTRGSLIAIFLSTGDAFHIHNRAGADILEIPETGAWDFNDRVATNMELSGVNLLTMAGPIDGAENNLSNMMFVVCNANGDGITNADWRILTFTNTYSTATPYAGSRTGTNAGWFSGVPTNDAVYLDAITNIPAGAAITITTNGRIRTVAHTDTSSQTNINNSSGNVIQDLFVDTNGHLTNAGSVDLDGRYYTETEADALLAGKVATNDTIYLAAVTGATETAAATHTVTKSGRTLASTYPTGIVAFVYRNGENAQHFIDDTTPSGGLHPLTLTDEGGLSMSWDSSQFNDHAETSVVTTVAYTSSVTDSAENWLLYDGNSTLVWSTAKATGDQITVAFAAAQVSDIWHKHTEHIIGKQFTELARGLRTAMPSRITDGMQLSATNTGLSDIEMSGGIWLHGVINQHDPTTIYVVETNLNIFYKTNGIWTNSVTNAVDLSYWQDGSNLAAVANNKYYRHVFFLADEETNPKIGMIYGATEFAKAAAARALDGATEAALPPGLISMPKLSAMIFEGTDTTLPTYPGVDWIDLRPTGADSPIAVTPTLNAVLTAGSDAGGQKATNLGAPTPGSADSATAKYSENYANLTNITGIIFHVDKNGTNQTLGASWTKLTWAREIGDVGGDFDLPNDRFLTSVPGWYLFYAQALMEPTGADALYNLAIYTNGVLASRVARRGESTSSDGILITYMVHLNATDYVELYASSPNQPLNGAAEWTYFEGVLQIAD